MLNKCCCCCNLVTGGKVLGWLEVVAGVIAVLNAIFFRELGSVRYTTNYGGSRSYSSYSDDIYNPYGSSYNSHTATHVVHVPLHVSIVMGLSGFSYLLLGCLLLFGIYKEKAQLVYYWVIISSVRLLLSALYSCYISISVFDQAYLIVSVLIFAALEVYFIICIYSLYKQMISPEGMHGGAVLSRPGQPHYAAPPTVVYGLPTAPQCGQPMYGQPMHGQPTQGQPMLGQPMQGGKPQYSPQTYNQA